MDYFKFPKISHLPWSNPSKDDKIIKSMSVLENSVIVVTEKLDGENSAIYHDKIHARSVDSVDHDGRHFIKSFHAKIKYLLPDNIRLCIENLYAKHSIAYDLLEEYHYLFGVFKDTEYVPFDEVIMWSSIVKIPMVPILYRGQYSEKVLRDLCENSKSQLGEEREGYVVRVSDHFFKKDFNTHIAKYVRPNHVQTDEHWMNKKIIKNKLKGKG